MIIASGYITSFIISAVGLCYWSLVTKREAGAWDDLGTEGSIGREHAMEANEMEPGAWDECSQAFRRWWKLL